MLIVYDLFNPKLIVEPNCDFRRNLFLISFGFQTKFDHLNFCIMSWLFGLNKNDPLPMEAPQVL